MSKNIVLGVMSSMILSIGLFSQSGIAQTISVNDFKFNNESIQEIAISLNPGRLEEGQWEKPSINVVARGYTDYKYEAILSIYPENSDEPIVTKFMEPLPIVVPYEPLPIILGTGDGAGPKSPYISIYPPLFPRPFGYTAKLEDAAFPAGLPAGSYVAQIDFYYVTDGNPQGPEWTPWQYGKVQDLYSKLIASSGLNFELTTETIELAKFVEARSAISASTIPLPRSTIASRNRLLNHAKTLVANNSSSIKTNLEGLSNFYRVSPNTQWVVTETGGDRTGLSKFISLYGYTHNNKISDLVGTINANGTYNRTARFTYPEGTVVLTIKTTIAAK